MKSRLPPVIIASAIFFYKTWHNEGHPHPPEDEVEWHERLTRAEVRVTASAANISFVKAL